MTNSLIREAGTLTLDGKPYRLVRPKPDQLAYKRFYIPESPYEIGRYYGGALHPPEQSYEEFTWAEGGFKSHPGIQGTSEYGQNTDARWPFRLMPGPGITTLTLPSSATVPGSIIEALGYVFIVCGQRIYRVDPATDTVVLSLDLGGGNYGIEVIRWEDDYVLLSTNGFVRKLAAGGIVVGGPDTWTVSVSTAAWRWAAGTNRLFKISSLGVLKDIVTGLDPMVEANWGDSVQVGEKFSAANGMVAYGGTVFIGKAEGFFAVGPDGFGIPQIRRMSRDLSNCYGMKVHDPYILIPHSRGLYRFYPGQVDSVGLETEHLNESPVRGRVRAVSADGNGFYFWVNVDASNVYLCYAKERKSGQAGLGPYIIDTLAYQVGNTWAALTSSTTAPPRLWFGFGFNLCYVKLSGDGGVPGEAGADYPYATSGTRYGTPFRFDDWAQKDWTKVQAVGLGCSVTNFWQITAIIDGVSVSLDYLGNPMYVKSDGQHTFYLPSTAVGVTCQPLYTLTNPTSAHPMLKEVKWFATHRADRIRATEVYILLESGLMHDEGIDTRSAQQQLTDLENVMLGASAVLASGPWGDNQLVWLREIDVEQSVQDGVEPYSFLAKIRLQERQP